MLFLIEIEKFRDSLKLDRLMWSSSYKDVDAMIAQNPTMEWAWKSRVSYESVMEQVKYIYDNFIHDGAPHQICVSSEILARTNSRVTHIAAYGRETFHEMSLDPLRTIEKDILPRFVASPKYSTLCDKLQLLTE